MGEILYFDTVLAPLSLFLPIGYHAYLWQCFKSKPSHTYIGIDALRRKGWFLDMKEDVDQKGMLAIQSVRNTLMSTIFIASIAVLVSMALAALTNNAYNASQLFRSAFFGSQIGGIVVLKYGSASLFLLVSFLCSSMAVGFLIDANFLINIGIGQFSSPAYTQTIFERGFTLALIGNRMLCMTFPLILWIFGPVSMALSSLALVWGLYELDFPGKLPSVKHG
ncbi:DUF599 domain-containing protein [Cephalotus follicularis]|uniref:DUF599 domain-containing protein n=1 Tax=Cephalotus follicularis TaxID=3775 RepID=A0A1Q3BQP7_CEPFO|nr:DUF599 domain-containing protein [Cephalotus follicularis]